MENRLCFELPWMQLTILLPLNNSPCVAAQKIRQNLDTATACPLAIAKSITHNYYAMPTISTVVTCRVVEGPVFYLGMVQCRHIFSLRFRSDRLTFPLGEPLTQAAAFGRIIMMSHTPCKSKSTKSD